MSDLVDAAHAVDGDLLDKQFFFDVRVGIGGLGSRKLFDLEVLGFGIVRFVHVEQYKSSMEAAHQRRPLGPAAR